MGYLALAFSIASQGLLITYSYVFANRSHLLSDLLCARHKSKGFTCYIPFNPHNTMRLLCTFY